MFRAGGKVPDDVPCPTALFHVWCWFAEEIIPATHEVLTWQDVRAWSLATGRQPTPEECRLLVQLHARFRVIAAEQAEKQKPDAPVEDVSVARSLIRKAAQGRQKHGR